MSERGTVLTMTNRILKLLKECSVEIIILDEFQHFIDRNSDVVLKEVADWLKQLIDSAEIPIVLVGLPESEYVLKENKQLSRRFSQRCSLDPFPFEKQGDRKAFRKVLATLDSLLPLSKDSNLSSGDMPERFFYASDGFIAYIAKLLRFAAEFAIETGLQNLNRGVLAKVFHEQIHPDKPGKDNPFLPDKFDISYDELVKSQKDILLNKMNKRIKSNKPKRNLNDLF